MTEQEYLESRVEDQLKWYSAKSGWNHKLYMWLRLVEIALASLIPLIVVLPIVELLSKALVAAAGATIAVISGAISLWKFQENWVEYRATAENLKREKFLFVTRRRPTRATIVSRSSSGESKRCSVRKARNGCRLRPRTEIAGDQS